MQEHSGSATFRSSPIPKTLALCLGVDGHRGGIETFFRELVDAYSPRPEINLFFVKGRGPKAYREEAVFNIPRNSRMARFLGAALRRNGYVAEQLSAVIPVIRIIRREKPAVVFYSDSNIGFQLLRWREKIGVPFKLLFSNGGPVCPPFPRADYVHQVTPVAFEQALAAGVPAARQRMIPYGISVPVGYPDTSDAIKKQVRERIGLPVERKIVLSVGWVSATHKRMDHLIREIASLRSPRPYLALVGRMDETSEAILSLATKLLGSHGFCAVSVPYERVADFYIAADVFALASLKEGFGRVFLEALIHGLPVIAHDDPVMRYVLGEEGVFVDMSKPSALAPMLEGILGESESPDKAALRRSFVRERFDWDRLAPAYADMFEDCASLK